MAALPPPAQAPPPPAAAPAAAPAAPAVPAAAPGGAAVGGAAWEQHQQLVKRLRLENQDLQTKISQLALQQAAGAGRPEGGLDAQLQQQQLDAKDARLAELRGEMAIEKEQAEAYHAQMRVEINQLEQEHATLRMHHQSSKGGQDGTETHLLMMDVQREEELSRQLQAQLQRLESNQFISKIDDRRETNNRVRQLEDIIKQKADEYHRLADERVKAEQDRLAGIQNRQLLDERSRDLKRRNEQLQIALDAMESQLVQLEREMRLMRERLPVEGQEALERALATVANSQSAAFARLDRPVGGSDTVVPSSQDLLSADSMGRILERLRQERAVLQRQIEEHRQEIQYEGAKSSNLRAFQLQELEEQRQLNKTHLLDRERWERIAAAHLQTIQDLQKRIADIDAPKLDRFADTASSAGFSDLSDLEGFENSLEVFFGEGSIETGGLEKLPGFIGVEQLRVVVCAEMRGFDAGYTAVAAGSRPRFDSLVSFGPFVVDDSTLQHFMDGNLHLELRAALSAGSEQRLLGVAKQPLKALLSYSRGERRNPVVGTTLHFFETADTGIPVARLRLKLRLRYSVEDLLEDFQQRADVHKIDREHYRNVDKNLVDSRQALVVHVRRVCGLPPAPRQRPEALRPYIYYQLPGQAAHFTRTGSGPHTALDDQGQFTIHVDGEFCKWVETAGGLHFIVFDDSASSSAKAPGGSSSGPGSVERALGMLGEVKVSLRPLLHDAVTVVEGTFLLVRDLSEPAAAACGTVDICVRWQDLSSEARPPLPAAGGGAAFAAASPLMAAASPLASPVGAPFGGLLPAVMNDFEYQAVLSRLVRRLAARDSRMSVEKAFDHLDVRKLGALSREAFLEGVAMMQVGLSDLETARLFSRLDADGDGRIVLAELREALASSTAADAPQRASERWANDIFDAIRNAMERRTDISLAGVYERLSQQALPCGIDRPRFSQLLKMFRPDLTEQHLDNLWLIVDKDRDGLLSYGEFADTFAAPKGLIANAQGASLELTTENAHILVGRILRRYRGTNVATHDAVALVRRFDRSGRGVISRAEFEQLLAQEGPTLSQLERVQLAAKLDADCDGSISAAELQEAFRAADAVYDDANRRAASIFERIRVAVARSVHTPQEIFRSLCKRRAGVMNRQEFDALVQGFAPEVDAASCDLMWQFVDKDSDGSIQWTEFAQHFAQSGPAPPGEGGPPPPPPPPPGASPPPPGGIGLTQECNILVGRVLRRFRTLGLPADDAAAVVRKFDRYGRGVLSRGEFERILGLEAPNLSQAERMQLSASLDSDGDGDISALELQEAFRAGDPAHKEAEQKAAAVFERIGTAIAKSPHNGQQLFQTLCKMRQGVMTQTEFDDFVRQFAPDLPADSALLMWRLVDKDRDGSLTWSEFSERFVKRSAPPPAAPMSPLPPPGPLGGGPPPPPPPPGPAVVQAPGMTEEYFAILIGRLLQRLKSVGVSTTDMAAVVRRFDRDGNGTVSRAEFERALVVETPNLSTRERSQLAAKMDDNNDGFITAAEIQAAFQKAQGTYGNASRQAEVIFARIREVISRSSHGAKLLFDRLCKQRPGVMSQAEFDSFVRQFAPTLDAASGSRMWQLLDKDGDDSVSWNEFRQYFDPTASSVTHPMLGGPPGGYGGAPPSGPPPPPAVGLGGATPPPPGAPGVRPPPLRPAPPQIETSNLSQQMIAPPSPAHNLAAHEAERKRQVVASIKKLLARKAQTPQSFVQLLAPSYTRDGFIGCDRFVESIVAAGVHEDKTDLRKWFLDVPGCSQGRVALTHLAQALSGSPPAPGGPPGGPPPAGAQAPPLGAPRVPAAPPGAPLRPLGGAPLPGAPPAAGAGPPRGVAPPGNVPRGAPPPGVGPPGGAPRPPGGGAAPLPGAAARLPPVARPPGQ
eukprot:TRINITY_DN10380_c0_g1_i1.p1 TRINITY_DN10380_c0_g1~~TRINITY_DN10380_c0_g1_i1.p1  ORF type:complete len:1890 (+),score=519.41 TRINITY_DN10380_c0_g1_i1:164-5833(+)